MKLLLIDGNSIMNRAFYGVPDLTNVNGLHTNAVYGFLNILFRFLDEENPDYLAIAFDLHAPTFRHKMYEAYKGTRKGMPDELREQVPYIKNLVKEMNIKTLELEGYEADDLLGTMAKRAQSKGMEVSLLSGDRDLLQIADEHIKIRVPKTIKGQTTVEDYYPKDVFEKYKVTPSEFIQLKALMGDSSDNIPGVPKVGEKTASELVIHYHSLDKIYECIDEIKKDSIRNSLKDNKDLAYLCLKLATIETNAPIKVEFEELKNEITYSEGGYNILKELGETEGAKEEFSKVLELSPGYSWAHFNIASIDYEEGNYSEAVYNLEKTLEFNPKDVEAYKIYSKILMKNNELFEAETVLMKALDNCPEEGDLYYFMAQVYKMQENKNEYIKNMTEAIRHNTTLSISAHLIKQEMDDYLK